MRIAYQNGHDTEEGCLLQAVRNYDVAGEEFIKRTLRMNTTDKHDVLCLIHRCPRKDNLFEWVHTPPGDNCHYCGAKYSELWLRRDEVDVMLCRAPVEPETKIQGRKVSNHV